MSNSNRVPNLRRPFAICYHCDIVEGLTKACEDGWTLLFRDHRMWGYLCPSCTHPAQPHEAEPNTGGAEFIPQQGDRTHQGRTA